MDQPEQQVDFASITADIVSSYVANNSVHRAELPNVIASVHAALQGLERVDIHLVQMKALTRQRIDMNARGVCS